MTLHGQTKDNWMASVFKGPCNRSKLYAIFAISDISNENYKENFVKFDETRIEFVE